MKSNIIIATALQSHVRVYLADTTDMVEKARLTHDLWPSSCTALGRSLSITSVMASMLKGEDEAITTIINGNGPIGTIMCIATGNGKIKGFCGNNAIYLKRNSDNKLIVGDIVGKDGYLKVIKDLKMKSNYTSEIELVSGEISEDFAYYYRSSEQTPCVISSGVLTGENYKVESAGCLFIELMPGYSEEDIQCVENLISKINNHPVTSAIKNNENLDDYLKELFDDLIFLDKKYVEYECNCSREKFLNNLSALPKKDIMDLMNDESIETKCEFCNKKYVFTKKDLESLIK